MDAQQFWWPKFQCCRTACVEQLAAAPTTRHELCAIPEYTENISVWELVNHATSWLFATLRRRNTLIYLHVLAYLLTTEMFSVDGGIAEMTENHEEMEIEFQLTGSEAVKIRVHRMMLRFEGWADYKTAEQRDVQPGAHGSVWHICIRPGSVELLSQLKTVVYNLYISIFDE